MRSAFHWFTDTPKTQDCRARMRWAAQFVGKHDAATVLHTEVPTPNRRGMSARIRLFRGQASPRAPEPARSFDGVRGDAGARAGPRR
jgi:hypothetical protein